jgi:pSer/pThr/pTyr-binding forkhead associated (FHA) protein
MRADPLRIDASFASQEVYEGPTAFGPWEGLASACLEIIDGPQKGDTFPLTHCPITIGRWASGPVHQEGSDPDTDKTHVMACDAHRPSHLVLEDPSQEISERHAHIELDKGEYYLIDHSTNGTKVNGEELKPNVRYRLNDGAEISLAGQVRLRFRRHGPGGTVLQRENPS